MEEHSIFRIYKKENYKFHIVNRKYSASQTISKSYIEVLLNDKDDKIPKVNTLVPIITC